MKKVKVNKGLLALILVASIFIDWKMMLLIATLILLFAELDEDAKKIFVTVVAFMAGIALFGMFMELIVTGVDLLMKTFRDFMNIINAYLTHKIDIYNVEKYVFNPVTNLLNIVSGLVEYLILLLKFIFVISILKNKDQSKNIFFKIINKFVDKFTNYFNFISLKEEK